MNNTFDNYDTELQCEEYYQQPAAGSNDIVQLASADVAHDAISSSQSVAQLTMKIDGKIAASVFRHAEMQLGMSCMENEPVAAVHLKSHADCCCTMVHVLSMWAVQALVALTCNCQD